MKALARAGYDYIKLMVAELQKQRDHIEEHPLPITQQAAGSPIPPARQRPDEIPSLDEQYKSLSCSILQTCDMSSGNVTDCMAVIDSTNSEGVRASNS